MKKTMLTLVLLSLVGISFSAEASRRLVINMGDAHYKGNKDKIIYLKQELRNAYPRLDLRNMDLERVSFVAKSKHGRGTAELHVGYSVQDVKNIDGSPRSFYSSRPRSFDRINMSNYGNSQGNWQIHMFGNIKVRKVVVFAKHKNKRGRRGRVQRTNVGDKRFDKIIYNIKTFPVNQRGVVEVSIVGVKNSLDVKRVVAKFRNGTRKVLHSLSGVLYGGEVKTAYVSNRNVVSVQVEAMSREVFGGRAKLGVEIGYR